RIIGTRVDRGRHRCVVPGNHHEHGDIGYPARPAEELHPGARGRSIRHEMKAALRCLHTKSGTVRAQGQNGFHRSCLAAAKCANAVL
ncbi:hypothetical protein ABTN53_19460, partial [Acinetobacter baumannii]